MSVPIPPPPWGLNFENKKDNSKNCRIKKSDKRLRLEKEWKSDIKLMNNFMLPKPTFNEWLALKYNDIDFKKYSNI